MKTTEQELQASNATLKAIRDGLAGVLPKDVVIPEDPAQLAAFITGQFTTANTRATTAEGSLATANTNITAVRTGLAAVLPKDIVAPEDSAQLGTFIGAQFNKVTAENTRLTEANGKLEKEKTDLAAKEQDLDKRSNAKFREFCAAQNLNPDAAPKAGKAGNGSPAAGNGSLTEQLEAIEDPAARAAFRAEHADALWAEAFKRK